MAGSATVPLRVLLVGIGNSALPDTRHNAGVMAIDRWWDSVVLGLGKKGFDVGDAGRVSRKNSRLAPLLQPAVVHGWRSSSIVTGHVAAAIMTLPPPPPRNLHRQREQPAHAAGADEVLHSGERKIEVVCLKPKGFMNFSGGPVKKASNEYKVPPHRVLVLHDDLDRRLAAVSLKYPSGASSNGHNGVRSIQASLQSSQFGRLRIGIGRPPDESRNRRGEDVQQFVLGRFSREEVAELEERALPEVEAAVLGWLDLLWNRTLVDRAEAKGSSASSSSAPSSSSH
ncbi:peptidyl-tRNA hydrolase-domain-containing protein [Zopfochytrium polystomum]|nr:peptidyl-tRNA hydrolase-domain-containing protein [Zopfochytrium polystomum]